MDVIEDTSDIPLEVVQPIEDPDYIDEASEAECTTQTVIKLK